MKVYDAQRHPITLGEVAGRGGEAVVYRMVHHPDRLAKIFQPEPRDNYAQKLAWMTDHPPQMSSGVQGHPALAWPGGLLFNDRQKMVGYWMPYVSGAVPVLDVFNPRRRALTLPKFDRRYLHRSARNLAAALSVVHRSGYVVGDLNENNILVAPSALVTLIDTDSFQVREPRDGRYVIHPCPVGKIEYMAPELQGLALNKTKRGPEHDAFALSVLIFQLLMEGNHPFRAQWMDKGDPPPLETRIAQGIFPYAAAPAGPVAPPPNTPGLQMLHPEITEMIRRSFIDGHRDPTRRPRPRDWERAIGRAELALVTCVNGHIFSNHLPACPFCPATVHRENRTSRQKETRRERPYRRPVPPRARPPQGWQPSGPGAPVGAGSSSGTVPRAGNVSGAGAGFNATASAAGGSRTTGTHSTPRPQSRPRQSRYTPHTAAQQTKTPPTTPQPPPAINPFFYRGSMWDWVRPRLQKSIGVGGGVGAAAGLALAAPLAAITTAPGETLAWPLICAAGGLLAGLLRGVRPAQRLGNWIGRRVGWNLFWRGAGLAIGGLIGLLVGLLFIWLIIPVFAGAYLGGRFGLKAGEQVWLRGQRFGWERLWVGFSGIGAALTGALIGYFAAQLPGGVIYPLAVDFQTWMLGQSIALPLAAGAAGALAGALGGFSAGLFMDLVNRTMGLLD